MGEPPTDLKARTGEETPPGMIFCIIQTKKKCTSARTQPSEDLGSVLRVRLYIQKSHTCTNIAQVKDEATLFGDETEYKCQQENESDLSLLHNLSRLAGDVGRGNAASLEVHSTTTQAHADNASGGEHGCRFTSTSRHETSIWYAYCDEHDKNSNN